MFAHFDLVPLAVLDFGTNIDTDYLVLDMNRLLSVIQPWDPYDNMLPIQLSIMMNKENQQMEKILEISSFRALAVTYSNRVPNFNDITSGKVGRWNWRYGNIYTDFFRLIYIASTCIFFGYNDCFDSCARAIRICKIRNCLQIKKKTETKARV